MAVSNLTTFKEKHIIDLKYYKEQLDGMLKTINMQLDTADKNNKDFINLNCKSLEISFKEQYKELFERVSSVKMENSKYSMELMNATNDLKKENERMNKLREEFSVKSDQQLQKMIDSNKSLTIGFDFLKSDLDTMKKKFTDLSQFIKVIIIILNIFN